LKKEKKKLSPIKKLPPIPILEEKGKNKPLPFTPVEKEKEKSRLIKLFPDPLIKGGKIIKDDKILLPINQLIEEDLKIIR